MATEEDVTSAKMGLEGEENLITIAQRFGRAIGTKKKLTDDERKILGDLGIQLLTMSRLDESNEGEGVSEIHEQLNARALGTGKNLTDDERKIPMSFRTQFTTISKLDKSEGEGLSEIKERLDLRALGKENLTGDEKKIFIDPGTQLPTMSMSEGLSEIEKRLDLRALGKENLTGDEKKIFIDPGNQLPTMSVLNESTSEGLSEIEERLNVVEKKIISWKAVDQSMISDSDRGEFSEFLSAVSEAQKLTESLKNFSLNEGVDDRTLSLNKGGEDKKLLPRACDVLQMAMARLEEEFRCLLTLNRESFGLIRRSFCSSEGDLVEECSIISSTRDSFSDMLWEESFNRCSEENIIDLVHPEVIPHLICISNLMFLSNYGQECSQAYVCVRKDALDDCLFLLEMEKLSLADALRMEWAVFSLKIKRQLRAMKIFVRVNLASEKRLSDLIFGELGSASSVCFVGASKVSILQLLNFCEAIATGPHLPEKLFRILDMYEMLADLLPDIDALFSDDAGCSVRTECREILQRLSDAVRATYLIFENAIASNISADPLPTGAIHHLTKYVMNYIKTLVDYSDTLNLLLNKEDSISVSAETSPVSENKSGSSSCTMSPIAIHFGSVTSILEANLDEKSRLYGDASLQHFFLMNNIHYMAQKVKNSELKGVFGDGWIRQHNSKFQHHAMNYERATWSSIVSLLRDDGLYNSGSHHVSKSLLKERFRIFYVAFDEVYKTQTAWVIPDLQLRDDVRISTALKVIQAYRTFVGRHINDISDKYIKYSADDLENYLMDLFEGTQRSLQHLHKK